MTTTASQARNWHGAALLSFGFRPFFFFGSIHAALMVALWLPAFLGFIAIPSSFPPVAWHAHELLFGYVPAVVAGFLLTAVPNWTGRLPVVGGRLAALFCLWVLGRAAIMMSSWLGTVLSTAVSIAFLVGLFIVVCREILAARNFRNLKVLIAVGMLAVSQCVFHFEVQSSGASIYGSRLAVAATIALIMVIGGRIIPSFTLNWIKRENPGREPVAFNSFDKISLILAVIALGAWVALPSMPHMAIAVAGVLLFAGVVHIIRQIRWAPYRTLREPLVTVLHVAYAFVPLGFLLAAIAAALSDPLYDTAALHAWTVGAIGLMTLAVMTRATRGHTGRLLTAPFSTVMIYAAIVVATLARIATALMPQHMLYLLPVAGIAWVGAFLGFAVLYGAMLVLPRPTT